MSKHERATARSLMSAHRRTYKEIYEMCLAITGAHAPAHAALTEALIACGPDARRAVKLARELALENAPSPAEGFSCLEDTPEAPLLSEQSDETRRAAMLALGCGLKSAQAAKVMGVKTGEFERLLNRALACAPAKSRAEQSALLKQICVRELKQGAHSPDAASLERSLENRLSREDDGEAAPSSRRRALSWLTAIIMLIVIGFTLWTCAVMLNYFRLTEAEKTVVTEAADG